MCGRTVRNVPLLLSRSRTAPRSWRYSGLRCKRCQWSSCNPRHPPDTGGSPDALRVKGSSEFDCHDISPWPFLLKHLCYSATTAGIATRPRRPLPGQNFHTPEQQETQLFHGTRGRLHLPLATPRRHQEEANYLTLFGERDTGPCQSASSGVFSTTRTSISRRASRSSRPRCSRSLAARESEFSRSQRSRTS